MTNKELQTELAKYPDDLPVQPVGDDCIGYDFGELILTVASPDRYTKFPFLIIAG